jgi:hypothetical protein
MCVVSAGVAVERAEEPRNRVKAAEGAKVVSTLNLNALGA